MVSTSDLSVYYPNQSGWRSFGLAVGMAVLLAFGRQPLRRLAWILGGAAIILTLAAYYVNRPRVWNLWTVQFLYIFLMADFLDFDFFRYSRRCGVASASFDCSGNTILLFFEQRFFERVKIRLVDRYHPGVTTSGWQVWQLLLPDKMPEHRLVNGE